MNKMIFSVQILALSSAMLALGGCNFFSRVADLGDTPQVSSILDPTERPEYRPVSMPMPKVEVQLTSYPASLWRPGSRAFFEDQRASQVGDILTVIINLADNANISNATNRNRTSDINTGIDALLGVESGLGRVLPQAIVPGNLLDVDAQTSNTGTGTIQRTETINLRVAAVVTQELPNGNLVLHGRQEMRVNFEVRELQVAGVIRPEDITTANTISYEDIAEARVSYGGRGQITDLQQPRYGSQLVDIVLPF